MPTPGSPRPALGPLSLNADADAGALRYISLLSCFRRETPLTLTSNHALEPTARCAPAAHRPASPRRAARTASSTASRKAARTARTSAWAPPRRPPSPCRWPHLMSTRHRSCSKAPQPARTPPRRRRSSAPPSPPAAPRPAPLPGALPLMRQSARFGRPRQRQRRPWSPAAGHRPAAAPGAAGPLGTTTAGPLPPVR